MHIVGLGLKTATQITREVEHAIRESQEVFFIDTGVATQSLLESLCSRVTPLYAESYSEHGLRVTAYEHMAARVVDAAMDHPPVTFAIHGHPLVAAYPPFLVMRLSKVLGLRLNVLPGISALDAILADLQVDPVIQGIQMYEATDLMLRRRPLQPDVPAIIWQIGVLETCLHTLAISRPERFDRFVAHLQLFYPPRHEVVAIYSSPHALMPPHILRFPLQDMSAYARDIHSGFTLYIPPLSSRPVHDHRLLADLYSTDHLHRITAAGDGVP